MSIFNTIKSNINVILKDLQREAVLPPDLSFEGIDASPPREASHGDVATNAAMVLAGKASMKPRDIAEKIVARLKDIPDVATVEIAGPGFINIRFAPAFWQREIPVIIAQGRGYGDSAVGAGKRVNVEYVSANPTGPMHVGHARGAVYGDALARLLIKAGFDVTKEYYTNDAGGQINKLAESVHLRYCEALGEAVTEIPEGLYPGDYLIPVGQEFAKLHGNKYQSAPKEEWLPPVRAFAVSAMMELIKDDLRQLGVEHDVFTSEDAITKAGLVGEALALLTEKGLIYEGVLEAPKGKEMEDWEARPQTLFRSTQFGDDQDRAIKKSDGSWTYFAPDIAYHLDKCRRGHDALIDVLGADHGGYVKRIKAVVNALTDGKVSLDVKLCQLVKFLRGGEPAKMSKRAGTFVTVREVIDEVGKDVLRFIMLTRKNDVPLDFDLEKVLEQSKDNPVFYVQYAHARCRSILRNAAQEVPEAVAIAALPTPELTALLASEDELAMIKFMANFPRVVESAADAYEPHRIVFYLQELASYFHGLWNKGNEENALRFIQKHDIKLTAARMMLATALATVLASGLTVLGVEPVEEMR